MTCPNPQVRLAPITTGLLRRNPRILLCGHHQPTLVRYLEGWPKRWQGSRPAICAAAMPPARSRRWL